MIADVFSERDAYGVIPRRPCGGNGLRRIGAKYGAREVGHSTVVEENAVVAQLEGQAGPIEEISRDVARLTPILRGIGQELAVESGPLVSAVESLNDEVVALPALHARLLAVGAFLDPHVSGPHSLDPSRKGVVHDGSDRV